MLGAGGEVMEGQGGAIGLVAAGGSAAEPGSRASDGGADDAGAGGAEDAGAQLDAAPPAPPGPPPPPPPPPCSANIELCDGLDNDCDQAVDEGAACAVDCAGFALADHGYMFCSASVPRDVAADRCELEGMRLA